MKRRELTKLIAGSCSLPLFSAAPFLTGAAQAAIAPVQLKALTRMIEVNGRAAKVFGLMQADGTHGLRLNPEENFNVALTNDTGAETMVHWHGLTPPWPMDGVPNLPAPLLKAGEQRTYEFSLGYSGTHWMHAHTLQEQALLAAPLIIRSKDDVARDEQEVVILLHDFSFTPAEELLAKLKSGGMGGMNMQGMDHSKMPGMKMGGGSATMDLNDIDYDAYLANDRTLEDPEVVQVEKGGTVRLRIINGATATGFTIDTTGLEGVVIAVDGQDIQPHKTSRFSLSMGQRVDFRIHIPSHGGAFPVFALREGGNERTGIILATAGAKVEKIPAQGETPGPVLTLDFEKHLQAKSPLPRKAPDRSFTVTLAGDMKSYAWSMQSDSEIKFRQGERVAIEMRNMSMMAHPMHLHGHHFQIVAIDGRKIAGAVRDTVLVPPMASVTFAFDANNPGDAWAFHCHHLYHMASGMMMTAAYAA